MTIEKNGTETLCCVCGRGENFDKQQRAHLSSTETAGVGGKSPLHVEHDSEPEHAKHNFLWERRHSALHAVGLGV